MTTLRKQLMYVVHIGQGKLVYIAEDSEEQALRQAQSNHSGGRVFRTYPMDFYLKHEKSCQDECRKAMERFLDAEK